MHVSYIHNPANAISPNFEFISGVVPLFFSNLLHTYINIPNRPEYTANHLKAAAVNSSIPPQWLQQPESQKRTPPPTTEQQKTNPYSAEEAMQASKKDKAFNSI